MNTTYKTTFEDLGLEIEYARLGANALWLATVGALKLTDEISGTNTGGLAWLASEVWGTTIRVQHAFDEIKAAGTNPAMRAVE